MIDLPIDIQCEIALFLSIKDIANIDQVCKYLSNIVESILCYRQSKNPPQYWDSYKYQMINKEYCNLGICLIPFVQKTTLYPKVDQRKLICIKNRNCDVIIGRGTFSGIRDFRVSRLHVKYFGCG